MTGILALFIPILALMIPIVAIVVRSPIGLAIAESIRNNGNAVGGSDNLKLRETVSNLEGRLNSMEKELNLMRESIIFYDTKKIDTSGKTLGDEKSILHKNSEKNLA